LPFVITNTKSGTAGTSSLWCENLAGGHAFGFNRTEACVFLCMCFDASHLWVLFTLLANYVSSTKMQLNQEFLKRHCHLRRSSTNFRKAFPVTPARERERERFWKEERET
jgi:hypothetical protein